MNNIGTLDADYYTLSFSDGGVDPRYAGWQSFYTYDPEDMIGMTGHLYSFKNGQLYRHNSGSDRNTYYGISSPSRLVGIFNQDPNDVKVFKTMNLEGTSRWDIIATANISSGEIQKEWLKLKEGEYYAHIRRVEDDDNYALRSMRGIGEVSTVTLAGGILTLGFNFLLDSSLSEGDKIYYSGGGGPVLIGTLSERTTNSLIINSPLLSPGVGVIILGIKNNVAESYGAIGYYMKFELENDSTNPIELFSVGSNVFKSYP